MACLSESTLWLRKIVTLTAVVKTNSEVKGGESRPFFHARRPSAAPPPQTLPMGDASSRSGIFGGDFEDIQRMVQNAAQRVVQQPAVGGTVPQ